MPRLTDEVLEQHQLPTGSYGYSAAALDDLGATEYTLVTIVQDVSSSVASFKPEMEAAIKEVVSACKYSPRADNLMIRLVAFNTKMDEVHGFKLLTKCNPDDYLGCLDVGGMTALFDSAENAIAAGNDYAKMLADNDFSVNAIVVIITDGDDNSSKATAKKVKKVLSEGMRSESLESIVTILIGVGTKFYPNLSAYLSNFQKEAGLTQYVEIDDATAKTLAKLAEFVSKSISAQSNALGSGGASQPISLKI